jgi:pilus assembly protein CpaE
MRAFIVSDHEPLGAQVRQVVLRHGHECPASHVVPLDQAGNRLGQEPTELMVMVLSPDPFRALAVLGELRGRTSGRVLAVGPAADSKLVLRVLRGGADDYIDEADLETELGAALGREQTQNAGQAEPARTVAVLAPSGGSGSSTLAANIATFLATEHKSALLVDLKLEGGDLAALLDLKPSHTLADLCLNSRRMDRVMFEHSLARHDSGVHLLAPPVALADVGHVTAEGVRQALTLARALFPYVVLDVDHSFREEQVQALRQADVVLVVLRLEFAALRNVRRSLEYLEKLGLGPDQVHVVVNRYGQPKEVPAAKAEEALGVKIFHYIPEDSKTINRANNNGVPAVLENPSAKVCKSMIKLAQSVNGRHH